MTPEELLKEANKKVDTNTLAKVSYDMLMGLNLIARLRCTKQDNSIIEQMSCGHCISRAVIRKAVEHLPAHFRRNL